MGQIKSSNGWKSEMDALHHTPPPMSHFVRFLAYPLPPYASDVLFAWPLEQKVSFNDPYPSECVENSIFKCKGKCLQKREVTAAWKIYVG